MFILAAVVVVASTFSAILKSYRYTASKTVKYSVSQIRERQVKMLLRYHTSYLLGWL